MFKDPDIGKPALQLKKGKIPADAYRDDARACRTGCLCSSPIGSFPAKFAGALVFGCLL